MSTSLTNHYMLFTYQSNKIERKFPIQIYRTIDVRLLNKIEHQSNFTPKFQFSSIGLLIWLNRTPIKHQSKTNRTSNINRTQSKYIYRVFLLFDWCSIAFDFFRLSWQSNFLIDIAWTKILFHSVYGVVKCCSI